MRAISVLAVEVKKLEKKLSREELQLLNVDQAYTLSWL